MSLFITPDGSRLPAASHLAGGKKAEKAARDFEAVLLGSLLESLQKTFAGTPEDDPSGSSNYGVMGTQALASAMAARGGIGIARMILQQWRQTKVPEMGQTDVPSGAKVRPNFADQRNRPECIVAAPASPH
jgi:Rod binding domain-containing protein